MSDQKYAPLRSEEDGEEHYAHNDSRISHMRNFNGKHLFINATMLAVGIALGWFLKTTPSSCSNDQLAQYSMVPSPAFEAISSQPLTLAHHDLQNHGHASPYQGFPTPETTARWMDLMDGYSIRVPASSLDALNLESIPLNDDSGDVWVSMNVYHHLHCLDSIRHQVAGVGCHAADGTNSTEHDEMYFPPHIDHCIETLRKRLICQPDLGVRAIAWDAEKPGVAFANNTVDSACVNWDAVQAWTKAHSFTEEERLISTPEGHPYPGPRTPPARCGQ